jgi:hypothetical protein
MSSSPNSVPVSRSPRTSSAPAAPASAPAATSADENTINSPPLLIVLETFTLDHQFARVKIVYGAHAMSPTPEWWMKVARNGDDGSDPFPSSALPVGVRAGFYTESFPVPKCQDKPIEFAQSRAFIMERPSAPQQSALQAKEVSCDPSYWQAERQFISYRVYTDRTVFQQDLDKELAARGCLSNRLYDQRYRENRVMLLCEGKKIVRYVLDGEELNPPVNS